jgi:hypothetical protein
MVVDVSTWQLDPQFPIHPQGKKPKKILIAPVENVPAGIIPGHRYLFKISQGWKSQQMWSEYICSRLGRMLSLSIPPCFIAYAGRETVGALVEFFYGFPGEDTPSQFVHAAEILSGFHRTIGTGRPNNFTENVRVCRVVLGLGPWVNWWTATVAFDALIGNTDRHTENWGFLVRRDALGSVNYAIAPLYDNGTSLGYQVSNDRLVEASSAPRIEKFVESGRGELGWDMNEDVRLSHFDLIARVLDRHPQSAEVLEPFARFNLSQMESTLAECSVADVRVNFPRERATFVMRQIVERQRRLRVVIGT